MQCCGVDNYQDFELSKKWTENHAEGVVIPATCCIMTDSPNFTLLDPECMKSPTDDNSYKNKVSILCNNSLFFLSLE